MDAAAAAPSGPARGARRPSARRPRPGGRTLVGTVSDCSAADVDVAVRAVAAVIDGTPWPLWQRREALPRAAALLLERRTLFASLISREGCKPVREAGSEVKRAAETVRLSAEQAHRLEGGTLPFGDTPRGGGRVGWYTREPVGVIGAITPFNDPLNLVAHKLGAGADRRQRGRAQARRADPADRAGVRRAPARGRRAGGSGRGAPRPRGHVGAALVSHPLVDMVSFTGGYATGDAVARAAGAKKTLMELGGNGAVIVLPDADVERRPRRRRRRVRRRGPELPVGAARVRRGRARRPLLNLVVAGHREAGRRQQERPRHRRRTPGRRSRRGAGRGLGDRSRRGRRHGQDRGQRDGTFYWPTVLTGVPAGARVLTEEVFGPVVSIQPYRSVDAAVAEVNGSDYGLQAGVFTRDIDTALDVAQRLRVGAVMINDTGDFRIDAMPFGGSKRSGVGREGVPFAVDAMTEPKIIAIHGGR